jgi:hypothetical protein
MPRMLLPVASVRKPNRTRSTAGCRSFPEDRNADRNYYGSSSQVPGRTELTKKPKTLAAYTTALNYFTESCRELYLHEIDRHDLLKFPGSFVRIKSNPLGPPTTNLRQ